jgi:hypothetical protein
MIRLCAAALLALSLAAPAHAADTTPPVIEHTPLTSAAKGTRWLQVFAKITDESKFFPQVFYRYGPGDYQKPIDMKSVKGEKHQFGGNVPVKDSGAYVEYYIEAYDELGNGPARSGDPEKPWRVDTSGGVAAAPAPAANPWVRTTPAPAPAPAPVTATPAPAPPPSSNWNSGPATPPPARTASTGGGSRTITWIVGGVGVGALVSGLVVGAVFKTEDDAYKQRVAENPAQFPSLKAQYDANKSLGRDATILMIAGGVLVAGGAALYFLEPGWTGSKVADNAQDDGLRFAAAPVDGGGAAVVAGRF